MDNKPLSRKKLESLAVFAGFLVVEHGEVGLVAALGDEVIFEGLKDGTAGLVGVGAVGKATVLGETENFFEITCQFFRFHIEGAKALDARCIDEPPLSNRNHLAECSSMQAGVVGIGDLGGAEIGPGHEAIDEGGLPHPAVAAQEGDLAGQQRLEQIDAIARFGRDLQALVTDGFVECDHHLLVTGLVGIKQIGLVEYEDDRYAIGLGRGEEAVDEGGRGLGVVDGDNEQCLIDIGGDDMALLREINTLANNVIASVTDVGDEGCALLVGDNRHTITDGDRVSATDTFQAKVALHLTIKKLAIVREDGVPASCIFNDEAVHYTVMISLFFAARSSSIFLIYLS